MWNDLVLTGGTASAEDQGLCKVRDCDQNSSDYLQCLQLRKKEISHCWKKTQQEGKIVERTLHLDLKNSNGIEIMQPQLYDNALLKQMLMSAQARLALLNVVDQTSITSRLGAISGGSSSTTSIAASIQGPTLPQVQTSKKAGAAAPDVTTTEAVPSIAAPALAGSTIPLPTNASVSSADVLNEQMQLSDQIANLSLLLQGPVSETLYQPRRGEDSQVAKPKVTIGIPVMVVPKEAYKNAVAVVEAYIQSNNESGKPSVIALLPREKTYNVAAITEKNLTTGSITTQIVSASGGFLRSRKSYYVVQDQDTLASTFTIPGNRNRVGVWWIFRPVLEAIPKPVVR